MKEKELLEFISMLLIENKCHNNDDFYDYFIIHSNKEAFNNRYDELLDKFLNQYAIIKIEKSNKKLAAKNEE